jgi:OOP family OmpA-OmpF porin
MSQMNQDDDQNFVLGIVGAIVLAILVGVVSLSISASNTLNEPPKTAESSETKTQVTLGLFDFSVADGKITLQGDVVDEKAKLSLLKPAKLLWGNDNVIDQLNIKPEAPRFWWNLKPFEVLSKLKSVPQFKLHLSDQSISGNAIVGSEEDKNTLLSGLKNWFTSDAKSDVEVQINPQLANSNSLDPNTLLNLQIEYVTGASDVPDAIKPTLEQIADVLKDSNRQFAINGHTDNVGVASENKLLSMARAEKIKDFLVSQGVPADQLSVAGFGDSKPIADNTTDLGRAKNRRIEFANQ